MAALSKACLGADDPCAVVGLHTFDGRLKVSQQATSAMRARVPVLHAASEFPGLCRSPDPDRVPEVASSLALAALRMFAWGRYQNLFLAPVTLGESELLPASPGPRL